MLLPSSPLPRKLLLRHSGRSKRRKLPSLLKSRLNKLKLPLMPLLLLPIGLLTPMQLRSRPRKRLRQGRLQRKQLPKRRLMRRLPLPKRRLMRRLPLPLKVTSPTMRPPASSPSNNKTSASITETKMQT